MIAMSLQAATLPGEVTATRLPSNPLLTVKSSPSIGDNVNGPSLIRVPKWVKEPVGSYYLYFADHRGNSIHLAYANVIAGPWKVHEPGALSVQRTAFRRPQPDPPGIPSLYTHVASPELWVDEAHKRIVMRYHGMWTDGNRWPAGLSAGIEAVRKWTAETGYEQFTRAALSTDGLHFEPVPPITKEN